jgi:hypothetical protein
MLPARKDLKAGQLAGVQLNHRLEARGEGIVFDCLTDFGNLHAQ